MSNQNGQPLLDMRFLLNRLRGDDSADPGQCEGYIWIVWFKVDGESVRLHNLYLEGTATVIGSNGNHGNIGEGREGTQRDTRDFDIPREIGYWRTNFWPIPIVFTDNYGNDVTEDWRQAFPDMPQNLSGIIGFIAVVMEADNTPDDVVTAGYNALMGALQYELDQLIPTLGIDQQSPTNEDIQNLAANVQGRVYDAIRDRIIQLDNWPWGLLSNLPAIINPDDYIGTYVWHKSTEELREPAPSRENIWKSWYSEEEGDWILMGRVDRMGAINPCFIATAAYDSPLAPQVEFLRRVRDQGLRRSRIGSLFVDAYESVYYKVSPYIAEAMQRNPLFKRFIRSFVVAPIVNSLMRIVKVLRWKT